MDLDDPWHGVSILDVYSALASGGFVASATGAR